MPGVRYGPDIADDAAFIMNNLVSLNAARKKAGKLTVKQSRDYDKFATLAKNIFGVSRRDVESNKFNDLGKLAQYSIAGRNPRGKPYSRSNLERNWRTGKIMQRGVRQEFEKRGGVDTRAVSGAADAGRGGATYLGRTKTKKFTELSERAYRRAARNGVPVGKRMVKPKGASGIDSLNIARTGPMLPGIQGATYGGTSNRVGSSIRPPKAKSIARSNQRKREKTVKSAGRGKGRGSTTAKKPRTPKRG